MNKKYIVRLSDQERQACHQVLKKCSAASQKARRAQILLKSDVEGPAWTDVQTAQALGCRTQTIENLRKRLVTEGFDIALNGKQRETPPTAPLLDAQGEAKLIALRLSAPPEGYGRWSLHLLAEQLVALGVVDSISHETVRQTLKKNGVAGCKIQYWVSLPEPDMTLRFCSGAMESVGSHFRGPLSPSRRGSKSGGISRSHFLSPIKIQKHATIPFLTQEACGG